MELVPKRIETPSLVGETLVDRYDVQELLSHSPTSEVYRAWRDDMQRDVAIKVLPHPDRGIGDVMAQVRNEVNAVSRLSHPNTISVFATGLLEDGRTFLVMELLSGGQTLRELMDAEVSLPVARSLHILRQIAAAVGEAHSSQVVHNNLKPDNIYISNRAGRKDHVTVLDFGMAKVVSTRHTGRHAVVSSDQYRAPEVHRRFLNLNGDAAADVYAIGCIAYEMLSGAPPFRKQDSPNAIPSFPPRVVFRVPNDVRSLVRRMLSNNPKDRPRDAVQLSKLLEEQKHRRGRTAGWDSPGVPTTPNPSRAQPIPDAFHVGRPHAQPPLAQGRTTLPDGKVAFLAIYGHTGMRLDATIVGGGSTKVGDIILMAVPLPSGGAALTRGRIQERDQQRVGGPVNAQVELVDSPDAHWLLSALGTAAATTASPNA